MTKTLLIRTFLTRTLMLASLSVMLFGCGNYKDGASDSQGVDSNLGFTTLSYDAVDTIVFKQYCYQCHTASAGNKGGINLETYANVKSALSDIQAEVQSNKMPLNAPPLSTHMKAVLLTWIADQAPETSTIPIPGVNAGLPPPPPPPPAGFDEIYSKILGPSCVRCHSNYSNFADVKSDIVDIQKVIDDGTTPHNGVKLSPDLVSLLDGWVKGNLPLGFDDVAKKVFVPYCVRCHAGDATYAGVAPKIQQILQAVTSGKMPKGGPALPADLTTLLNDWVNAGSPD